MPFEVKIIEALQLMSSEFLDGFMRVVSYFFDYTLVIVLGLILLCFKKYSKLILFLALEGIGALVQITLKALVNRPRPFVAHQTIMNIFEASNSSFPSGHSITCMCAVVVLWYMVRTSTIKKSAKLSIYIGLILALVLCLFNRMYLGQHYLTDVLAGFMIALILGLIAIFVYKKTIKKIEDKRV